MAEIYSRYMKSNTFFTAPKNQILGVVIHNDAGTLNAAGYEQFLADRVNSNTLANGFAAYYVDRNDIMVFQPSNRVEWHTANSYGNANFIGFEVCESMSADDATFIKNEDATLLLAAQVLQSWDLPINEDTVKLHHEFSSTACPHRSMALHSKGGAYNGVGTENCRQYFIKRMKELLNGENLDIDVENHKEDILDTNTNLEKSDKAYYEATIKEDYIVETAPEVDSPDKELLKAGTRVRVYEKRNGWSRVNYKDSDQWIEDDYLVDAEIL